MRTAITLASLTYVGVALNMDLGLALPGTLVLIAFVRDLKDMF